ncbi:CLUMA_CG000589, isoform A [Clunio marinus]|uniref:CLUMA_CG000589, isoform A n=1 Tax=Clunio marinus TaxID=568069 RepID=A0A1J1HFG3_9DIPT|nr:CLUMA_CG000589, isoform A [Clunio marinus]
MSEEEQQAEEIEALTSIYEGDTFYKQLNKTTFQYKYGEEENGKGFIVEIIWGDSYPNELPKISMDSYFNRNISSSFKLKIIDILKTEGENWIGCGMTYTLFECLKEQLAELLTELENEIKNNELNKMSENLDRINLCPIITTTSTKETPIAGKKEQLTKSQKRRMWERTDNKGQRQRGWDWVDIIRHLSQTGSSKDESSPIVTSSSIMCQPLAPPPNN